MNPVSEKPKLSVFKIKDCVCVYAHACTFKCLKAQKSLQDCLIITIPPEAIYILLRPHLEKILKKGITILPSPLPKKKKKAISKKTWCTSGGHGWVYHQLTIGQTMIDESSQGKHNISFKKENGFNYLSKY